MPPRKKLTDIEISQLDRRNNRKNDRLYKDVQGLKRAVEGYNGKTGLIGHAEQTTKDIKLLKRGVDDIKLLLTGDDTDLDDAGGMKGKIRDLSTMQKVVKRVMWLGIGSIVAGTVGIIFTVIRTFLLQAVP